MLVQRFQAADRYLFVGLHLVLVVIRMSYLVFFKALYAASSTANHGWASTFSIS